MGQTVSAPSGVTMRISTPAINGVTEYLVNLNSHYIDGYGDAGVTTSQSLATNIILESGTGYLYFVDVAGYYPIATISTGTPKYTPVFLNDASVVRAALTSYPPLICSITTPATAASGYNGTLTCYAPTQGGAPLTLFGYCGSTLVVFDNCTDFNLNCGTGLTTCSPFSTFQYTDLKPAIVGSSSSSRASTSKISTGTSVIGIASSSIPEKSTSPSTGPATTASISGSCSVTVMLYIEQSTTYVPNGYVAPPLGAGGVSTANGGLGGGGGGGSGNYGCTPITNTMTKSI